MDQFKNWTKNPEVRVSLFLYIKWNVVEFITHLIRNVEASDLHTDIQHEKKKKKEW